MVNIDIHLTSTPLLVGRVLPGSGLVGDVSVGFADPSSFAAARVAYAQKKSKSLVAKGGEKEATSGSQGFNSSKQEPP